VLGMRTRYLLWNAVPNNDTSAKT